MVKVLIVDDDEQLLLILTEILGKYKSKFEILPVKNGFEAIQALQQQKFSLVVTDLVMPRINGHVLLSYIAKNFPHIPCIIMTGYGTPELQERLEKKAVSYIQKPFAVTELAELILATLGLEQNVLGTMNGVSVEGFLKLVESESMTCLCEIQSEDGRTGYLIFEGGTLYNAFYENMRGREAALELFKLDRVRIKFRKPPAKKFPRRITVSIASLLREARN
jgi:CheY-like chemotaxis protein